MEAQIRSLQARQLEIFQLIVGAGVDCTDYDEELQQVNMAKTRLMEQKAELERTRQELAERPGVRAENGGTEHCGGWERRGPYGLR